MRWLTHGISSSQAALTKTSRLSTLPAAHRDRRSTCYKVFAMSGQENRRALAALGLQHLEEFPFSIELWKTRRIRQSVGHDPVRSHGPPARALAVSGIGGLASSAIMPQFLHQRRVEGNFVEAVQGYRRRLRRVPSLPRIDLDKDGVGASLSRTKRRNGGFPAKPPSQ